MALVFYGCYFFNNKKQKIIMKTKYLKKLSYLAIILLGLIVVSCSHDEAIAPAPPVNKNVAPETKAKVLHFTYHYNGTAYTEIAWNLKNNATVNPTFFIIGLNENLYLFDTQTQAITFENGGFKNILKQEVNNLETTNAARADKELSRATVIYKVDLYDNISFAGTYKKYYNTMVVKRMEGFWGNTYYQDNKAEFDLPSTMKNKTTSYKIELVQTGTVDNYATTGQPLYLTCTIKFRTGSLGAERNVNYTSSLYKGNGIDNSKREDSDLSNNRIWATLGLATWNDQIEAVQVEFGSF